MRRKFLASLGFSIGLVGILLTFPATLLVNPLNDQIEFPEPEESHQPPAQTPTPETSSSGTTSHTVKKTIAPSVTPTAITADTAPISKVITGLTFRADKYGDVQIQVTLANGSITAVKALKIPDADSRSLAISQMAVPILTFQTLEAKNSSSIQGATGASYTSAAWIQSLQSIIAQM